MIGAHNGHHSIGTSGNVCVDFGASEPQYLPLMAAKPIILAPIFGLLPRGTMPVVAVHFDSNARSADGNIHAHRTHRAFRDEVNAATTQFALHKQLNSGGRRTSSMPMSPMALPRAKAELMKFGRLDHDNLATPFAGTRLASIQRMAGAPDRALPNIDARTTTEAGASLVGRNAKEKSACLTHQHYWWLGIGWTATSNGCDSKANVVPRLGLGQTFVGCTDLATTGTVKAPPNARGAYFRGELLATFEAPPKFSHKVIVAQNGGTRNAAPF